MTRRSFAPKGPARPGWTLVSTQWEGREQTWLQEETGLVAVSAITGSPRDGRPEYRLALRLQNGARCPGALAFAALADFGMLDATAQEAPDVYQRVFLMQIDEG